MEKTESFFGGIDVLVNNAGFNDGMGLETPPEKFMNSVRTNLLHVYAMTHFSLPGIIVHTDQYAILLVIRNLPLYYQVPVHLPILWFVTELHLYLQHKPSGSPYLFQIPFSLDYQDIPGFFGVFSWNNDFWSKHSINWYSPNS